VSSEFYALRLSDANDFWHSGVFQPWTFGYTGRDVRPALAGKSLPDGVDYRVNRKLTVGGYFVHTDGLAVRQQLYAAGKDGRFAYLELFQRF
jgi:hypothetical protein